MGKLEDMKPLMAMLVLQFTYAGVNLFSRAAVLQGMSPRVFVVYRHAMATLFIAPVAFLSRWGKSNRASMGLKSFSLIFLAALVGVVINQNMYTEGLYLVSASIASAMANLVPAITFIMAYALRLEHINLRSLRSIAKIVGTILCVGGAIIMALLRGPKLLNNSNEHLILLGSMFGYGGGGHDNNWILGCLFLVGSCCCWAFWLILQVPMAASYPDCISLSAWMCFLASIQGAALTFFLERDLSVWIPNTKFQLGCVIYSGVIGSGISFFVQAWCIARKGPVFSAMFNPLCTVLVTILAAIFLHEEIYTGSIAGAIGVVIGLYIVLWGKAKDIAPITSEDKLPSDKIDLEEPLLLNDSPTDNIKEASGKDYV